MDNASREMNQAPGPEISFVRAANELLRERRFIVGMALASFVLVSAYGLLRPRTFSATASFLRQAPKTPSSLSGLAAQFGVALPMQELQQSPAFYTDLIKTREVLGATVDTVYTTSDDSTPRSLVEILEATGSTPGRRRELAIRRLRQRVYAGEANRTGVINLRVTTKDASLSLQLLERILQRVNVFNLETRQSQAAAERRFTEQRYQETQRELRDSEDRLQEFLTSNRNYANSPQLTFQHDRLQRQVELQQQVATTLAQSYEQAKIEQVRDTPVITIIERPELPVRPDPRGLVVKGLLALIAGALAASIVLLARQLLVASASVGDELAEFRALRRAALSDALRPWQLLRRQS
jgi:uncharacterized protein involved in exopolysaccharide biosynthesis